MRKVCAKVKEIDVVPCLVAPGVGLLDVLPKVITVYVESDAGIKLADKLLSVDVQRALLGWLVID